MKYFIIADKPYADYFDYVNEKKLDSFSVFLCHTKVDAVLTLNRNIAQGIEGQIIDIRKNGEADDKKRIDAILNELYYLKRLAAVHIPDIMEPLKDELKLLEQKY